MIRLLTLLVSYSPWLLTASLISGAVAGAANAGILALINTAIHERVDTFASPLVLGFIGLCILIPSSALISSLILVWLGQQAVLDLRVELSRQVLQAPLRRLEEIGAPQLYVVLTRDLGSVVGALVQLPNLVTNLTIVIGCLVYLGWLSWPILVLSMILVVVAILLYQVPVNRGHVYQRRAREGAHRLWKHFEAVTSGTKELKLHAPRQTSFLRQMTGIGKTIRRDTVVASTIFDTAASVGQLTIFAIAGVVVIGLPLVQDVEPKALTGYAILLLYMITPLQVILGSVGDLSNASVAVEKTESLGLELMGRSTDEEPDDAVRPQPTWSSLELVDVGFTYPGQENGGFELGPLSATLRPGELIFLVGGNGSGKTSLAKLIVGLYAPDEGSIRLDGEEISDARRTSYMQNFSTVFSDFYLFSELLGLEEASLDERAGHVLKQLQIDHKVTIQDGKLSTTELSQGQRKRLALLTAYLEDRPIYLFDEWAADQDALFRDIFYLQILPDLKRRGKTVVVISHDDRYYHLADRILKLDAGRLTYAGDPSGLQYGAVEEHSAWQ